VKGYFPLCECFVSAVEGKPKHIEIKRLDIGKTYQLICDNEHEKVSWIEVLLPLVSRSVSRKSVIADRGAQRRESMQVSAFTLANVDKNKTDQLKMMQLRDRISGFATKMGPNFSEKLRLELKCISGEDSIESGENEKKRIRFLFVFQDTLLITKWKIPKDIQIQKESNSLKKSLKIVSKLPLARVDICVTQNPTNHNIQGGPQQSCLIVLRSYEFLMILSASVAGANALLQLTLASQTNKQKE
jgi:hypothetical protein